MSSSLIKATRRRRRCGNSNFLLLLLVVAVVYFTQSMVLCHASEQSISTITAATSSKLKPSLLLSSSSSKIIKLQRQQQRQPFLLLRGGAAGGNQQSWKSTPTGIYRDDNGRQQQSSSQSRQQQYQDIENDPKEMMNSFLTRDSRNTFISRVYSILSIQLIVTAIFIFLLSLNPQITHIMRYTQIGRMVPFLSIFISSIAWMVMASSIKARRSSPLKWQLLSLFTIGEAISVGFISSFYKFQVVCSAMVITAVSALSVSVYTMKQKNPKYDLSQWGMGLSSAGMIFLLYGIIHLLEIVGFLPHGFLPYTEAAYSFLGSVLFSFYLAYHTKMIVGGKHTKYQMNEKDYVLGAMSLYNDIINIFIYILRLIGDDNSRRRD